VTLNYVGLVSPIVAAIQALAHRLTSLEATVVGFADNFVSAHITVTTLEADSIIAKKVQTQALCAQKSDGSAICLTAINWPPFCPALTNPLPALNQAPTPRLPFQDP
jgi:hypothetical protein